MANNRGPGNRSPGEDGPGRGADRAGPPLRGDLRDARYSGFGGREFVVPTNDRVRVITRRDNFDWGQIDRRANFNGCPPGLVQRYNGCNPPGLLNDPVHVWHQPDWYWSDYDRDYRYRYSDGYLLRLGAGTQVLSYIPLLGGALAVGSAWPSDYEPVALPPYYASYYDLGPATGYRYYDDTIYRVDTSSGAKITAIAALLTGNAITIGKPMPMGYEIYNVPYAYRDQYVDGPQAIYRYSDGHIYQLDPTTRLVRAAIELLS